MTGSRRTSREWTGPANRLPNRTACALLSCSPDCPQEGCTEEIMLAHGFTVEQLVETRALWPRHRYTAACESGWQGD
jgi:hypothetical protein